MSKKLTKTWIKVLVEATHRQPWSIPSIQQANRSRTLQKPLHSWQQAWHKRTAPNHPIDSIFEIYDQGFLSLYRGVEAVVTLSSCCRPRFKATALQMNFVVAAWAVNGPWEVLQHCCIGPSSHHNQHIRFSHFLDFSFTFLFNLKFRKRL